eukprot:1159103-Pelagomonas_calceolata.AAC.1
MHDEHKLGTANINTYSYTNWQNLRRLANHQPTVNFKISNAFWLLKAVILASAPSFSRRPLSSFLLQLSCPKGRMSRQTMVPGQHTFCPFHTIALFLIFIHGSLTWVALVSAEQVPAIALSDSPAL